MMALASPLEAKAPPRPVVASDGGAASRALIAIAAGRERCKNREEFPSPQKLEACDSRAARAANALLRRSTSNARFDVLLRDLFEPMVVVMSEGEEGEAQQVEARAMQADLSEMRAAILTGATQAEAALRQSAIHDGSIAARTGGKGRAISRPLFDWVDGIKGLSDWADPDVRARPLTRRWEAIRNADCAAYPVPHCAERLDAAMRYMIIDTEAEGAGG